MVVLDNSDFTITTPQQKLVAGSSLVLEAKISTVNRQYANVAVDIARVTDLTISLTYMELLVLLDSRKNSSILVLLVMVLLN